MATEVVTAVLLAVVAVGLAALYAQGTFHITKSIKQTVTPEVQPNQGLKYISIFRATITRLSEMNAAMEANESMAHVYRVEVSVYNGGSQDYNYRSVVFVVSDGHGFTKVIQDVNTTCPHVLPAGEICTFSAFVEYNGEPSHLGVLVKIDTLELSTMPTYVPPQEAPPAYFICHSCEQCTWAASESNYTQVIIDINSPVSTLNSCIRIARSHIVIACQSPLIGSGLGTAIELDHVTDVSLKNCTIARFHTGIFFNGAWNLRLMGVRVTDANVYAKWLPVSGRCKLGELDIATDKGPLPYFEGNTNVVISNTPGVWLSHTSHVRVTSIATPIVSPAIVLCEDADTNIYDVNVPASIGKALASIDSSGLSITGFASLASDGMLFLNPSGSELVDNVVVR